MSRPPLNVVRLEPALVARLYKEADAARWPVTMPSFTAALERSAAKAMADGAPDGAQIERYLSGLHLRDLALACACADSVEAAWDHFVLEFRPVLYRAADALDPAGGAREQADAIYADLFGLTERDGDRRSLFRYFHGRSSLATWLRAVLAQRQVDRVRVDRRFTPIDEEAPVQAASAPTAPDPDARRFVGLIRLALVQCLAALSDRDHLRLACYYREDLTLAQTGQLLGEHEATVSRQLARTRKVIREQVGDYLRREHGLDDEDIKRCIETTVEDSGPLDLREILSRAGSRKESEPERST